jgi:hypothetical protein
MKFKVALNGTETNPWEKFGLTQNPFPQLAKYEYDAACLRLQKLGGPPIPHDKAEQYIREVLKGFSKEFIDICCMKFEPGKMVEFDIHFDE